MLGRFRFVSESDDVYVVLVGELATGVVPTVIMGATFLIIGLFVATSLASPLLLVITLVGTLLLIAKLWLMLVHRRRKQTSPWDRARAARWERAHLSISASFAGMLTTIAFATFMAPDLALQMLATGMLFGYCSGIVARLSVRPALAVLVLTIAAVPVIASAAIFGGSAHLILSAVFALFLGGSFESVRYVHDGAARQIRTRLDMVSLARNDHLTDLSNRLGLREAFREMMVARNQVSMIAVHCFDLDGFKPINDRHGHPAGDTLLRMLAKRVRAMLREGDIAARIGGDEFVVVQALINHPDEADMFARRLSRAITAPYNLDGQAVRVGLSLGYEISPPGPRELDELLSTADAALYRMKSAGGGVARGGRNTAAA